MSFESLGLSAPVLQAVADKGYTAPTPIQEKAIPIVLMGRDVLGCAQTGTGKTASFMGFIPDVERFVSLLPPLRQTLFFSATMPPEIKRLADRFLSNPREVSVAPPASASKNIVQGLCVVPEADKREALRSLIKDQDIKNAIVFCNRKKDVAILQGSLKKHGFNAGALHGDMSQPARMETLEKFKQGEIQILVASDVAALVHAGVAGRGLPRRRDREADRHDHPARRGPRHGVGGVRGVGRSPAGPWPWPRWPQQQQRSPAPRTP